MLGQFKTMGAIANLARDKEKLRRVGKEFKARLSEVRVQGQAGGGAVRVLMSGAGEVLEVTLDPALSQGLGADDNARNIAQSLIADAINDALRLVRESLRHEASRAAGELGLPDLPGLDELMASL